MATKIFPAALLLAVLAITPARADEPRPFTLDLLAGHGWLTAGQPAANAVNLRGTWDRPDGDTVRAELLDEHKFGSHGGIVAASYTHVVGPDWIVAGALAAGHGGLNWANLRADAEVTAKWFEARNILTRVGAYRAAFDGNRSDTGVRFSLIAYTAGHFVVEGGGLYNVSQPSSVTSGQGYAGVTWGTVGDQYLSARYSGGTEAYQAIGDGRQLVGFHSQSLALGWRKWLARSYGITVGAEQYRNPSYLRTTVAVGVFGQW